MRVVYRFTVDSFAAALRAYVLPRETSVVDCAAVAQDFWDVELEGKAPEAEGDVDDLVDALIDWFPHLQDAHGHGGAEFAGVRRLLGAFMNATDADAAIVRHRRAATTGAQSRGSERAQMIEAGTGARVALVWRIYWVLGLAATATALVVAVRSGRGENVAVAAILVPGMVLIVAGIVSAVSGARRRR